MSEITSQPLTRAAIAAQAEAIAARQAAQQDQTSSVVSEVPIATPLVSAPLISTPPVVETPVVETPVAVPQIVVPIVRTGPLEERVLEQVPVQSLAEVEKDLASVDLDEEGNPQFKVSSALTGEFTGANLIIEVPADITAGGALITDTGELVITGSIDVSSLITPTGEIDISAFTDSSDSDLDEDAQENFIPGIPPIRVSGVIAKTSEQPGIPGGAHRGINPYWYFAMISVGSLLIVGGLAISFYFGLFN